MRVGEMIAENWRGCEVRSRDGASDCSAERRAWEEESDWSEEEYDWRGVSVKDDGGVASTMSNCVRPRYSQGMLIVGTGHSPGRFIGVDAGVGVWRKYSNIVDCG
jgi:hypothetical protein